MHRGKLKDRSQDRLLKSNFSLVSLPRVTPLITDIIRCLTYATNTKLHPTWYTLFAASITPFSPITGQ